jgi:hypothetical protein
MAIQKVTNIAIDSGAVTGGSLLDGTIQTADIADGAITSAKFAASVAPALSGGSINNTPIGQAVAAAGTFTALGITQTVGLNNVTATGTWTNLGTVTTVDINGGTADAVTIGASSAAAGTFTSITGQTLLISGTTPKITLSDSATPSLNIISADNATGTIEIRADDGNSLGSSSITQYIDGGIITTTNGTGQQTTGAITATGAVSGLTVKVNGNILSATAGTATITVPNATTSLVGHDLAQTLTNKTLQGAVISAEVTNTAASALQVAVGTTAERPVGAAGKIRYNTTSEQYEGYNGASSSWTTIGGGATGGINNPVFYENDKQVTVDYTVNSSKNAMSAGPIEVAIGVTVVVPAGSEWTVV